MRERMTDDKDWRRAARRRFLAPLAIAVAGIALIAATSGIAQIVGGGVLAVAVVVAISLVFLEVGYSEDRARERGEQ
jgi:Flp pilus assembly protein TadB